MPPRKSNASAAGAEDDNTIAAASKATSAKEARDDTLSVEDLNLPKSIVQRLAKGVLPANTSIQKDALLAISKSATVFVNYLTSHAADHAGLDGKKTVMPSHVYEAMQQLEFSFMLPRLEAEVAKFTSIQADKRNTYRKKVREEKKAALRDSTGGATDAINGQGDTSVVSLAGDGDEPAAKKARLERAMESGDDDEGDGEMEEAVDGEDEEVEDDETEEEEQEEGEALVEDLLEEKEEKNEDDDMADGDESD